MSEVLSNSTTISTESINRYVEQLKHQRCRDSTKKNYYNIWKIFNKFNVKLDVKPDTWEERLVLFMGFLIENKCRSSTINSYISGIKAILLQNNIKISEDRFLLSSLTRACKIKNDIMKTRLPISSNLIASVIRKIYDIYDTQPYLACMYHALFTSAYFGMLRIGEVTKSEHVIKAKDVLIATNKDKLMFILWSSKTHGKHQKPQIIKLSRHKAENCDTKGIPGYVDIICPYQAIHNYLKLRPDCKRKNEQFFVFSDGSPVKPENARAILNTCLKKIGLDQKLYSFHGIRGGRANELLQLGVSVETIKKLGCWKSNAIYVYLR